MALKQTILPLMNSHSVYLTLKQDFEVDTEGTTYYPKATVSQSSNNLLKAKIKSVMEQGFK